MVILIAGASHAGKTLLAQRILEKYHYPYLSIDHLKMGLIRSGNTDLTPEDDDQLTDYLWPIVREMVKTAIENRQNLVIEGCYIPFTWQEDFTDEYRRNIRYCCLIMSKGYVETHFDDIKGYANAIESRLDDGWLNVRGLIQEHEYNLAQCKRYGCKYLLIDGEYKIDLEEVIQ